MTHLIIKKTEFQSKVKIKSNAAVLVTSLGLALGMSVLPGQAMADESDLTYLEELGKRLFFENISDPKRMACASCHNPGAGGTNGHSQTNRTQVVVTGADPNGENHKGPGGNPNPGHPNIGSLKPPTNHYAQYIDKYGDAIGIPDFKEKCRQAGPNIIPCGGAFWNGRATGKEIEKAGIDVFYGLPEYDKYKYKSMYGKYLGPVTDQAHASPFINPVEQNHKSKEATCEQVAKTKWGSELYYYAWGKKLDCKKDIDYAFARFAVALGAWQMSAQNNSFDSKRDKALKAEGPFAEFPLKGLTYEENLGHDLFYGVEGVTNARCTACHRSGNRSGTTLDERYTDDAYHNIGVPRNYEIPGKPTPDIGVMFITKNDDHEGLHKTPTLRNVDKRPYKSFTKAYTHNGYFKTLKQLVHFYNTRDVKDSCEDVYGLYEATVEEAIDNNCWPKSEYPDTAAGFVIGNLRLEPFEEDAIVAYLKTLSDTTTVKPPKPYKSQKYDEGRLKHTYLPKP